MHHITFMSSKVNKQIQAPKLCSISVKMNNESMIDCEYDEWVADDADYVQEAEQIVRRFDQISIDNALILNKQMRIYLIDLKEELERMLHQCQEKYRKNESLLAEMNAVKQAPKMYSTYYFCGYPFFKDRKGGAPSKSAEYLRRFEKGDELFPLDLEKRGVWMPRDKIDLVQGVKKQTIEYLALKNNTRIRKAATKRCADELTNRIKSESDALQAMHLKDLLKQTENTDFRINWFKISTDSLQDRHTDNECMAMWYGYLMPTLNRKPWSPDEEDALLNATIKFGAQNWMEISKVIENRSSYQCFVHHQTHFNDKNIAMNTRWTADEDKQLIACVEKYRIGNVIPWTKVMENCSGRTKLQLYNRYMFTLNPEINRAPFTVEEDCILMAAIKQYGINYREFPTNLLPGRSMKQIRSRYNNVLKHVTVREHWTEQHDRKLLQLVRQYGSTDWVKVAEEMVSHSRTSCRQRYTTIRKFLDKNPNKTVSDVPRRKRAFSTNVTTENWMETMINANNCELTTEDECQPGSSSRATDTSEKSTQNSLIKSPYYDFFKYSFDFKLGEAITGIDALFENIQIACQLLQAPTIPKEIDVLNPSFSSYVMLQNNVKKTQLEPNLLRLLSQLGKNDFLYPVNLNTLLGLRGLTIMFEAKEKRAAPIKSEQYEIVEHDALTRFKERFKSIFKQTADIANLKRSSTSVALRLRDQNRHQTNEPIEPLKSDCDLSAALVPVESDPQESQDVRTDESDAEQPPPKRSRITILENIKVDPNTTLQCSQASTSSVHSSCSGFRYRVEPSDSIQEIKIQPYVSESETEGEIAKNDTDFVIWTPTITDEATGSATHKSFKQSHI